MNTWGFFGIGAVLGLGWFYFLIELTAGAGLVSMDLGLLIVDLIIVAALSFVAFALGSQAGSYSHYGWFAGQIAVLIYGAWPKGSPQMFQPTNGSEAIMVALIVIAVLNCSALPASVLGFFFGRAMRRPKKGQAQQGATKEKSSLW